MTKTQNLPKYLTIQQQTTNKSAEIFIQGDIVSEEYWDSDTSAVGFRNALNKIGDVNEINVHINSDGGNVFEGIAIHNMLKQNKAKINVYVDALAASIASVIAMSGDAIFMPSNSMLMIHNPWSQVVGNANDLRKKADELDQIGKLSVDMYLAKSNGKMTEEKVRELMDAETWLSADEAVDCGLADEVLPANQMAASIDKATADKYMHTPVQLLQRKQELSEADQKLRSKLLQQANASNEHLKTILGGLQ